jgi:hypothetical protein
LAVAGIVVAAVLVIVAAIVVWLPARSDVERAGTEPADAAALAAQTCLDAHLQPGVSPAAWALIDRACRERQGVDAAKSACVLRIGGRQGDPDWTARERRDCHAGDWLDEGPG